MTLIAHFAQVDLAHGEPKVQRSNEMEFDARVIRGQRAEGAVYLFQRSPRPLPPLLKYRRDYLKAIVTPVFGPATKLGQRALKRSDQSGVVVGSAAPARPSESATLSGATPQANPQRAKRGAGRGVGR